MAKKFLFIISYIVVLLFLLEMTSRIFLWFSTGVKPAEMIYKYYPVLKQVDAIDHKDGYEDILFLGASVIANGWSDGGVQTALAREFAAHGVNNVRIFNAATPAHSTLDSYYKYKHLINRKFDLVLIYDSINDTRANNCPPEMFKEDYSHYAWYEDLNLLDRHPEIKFVVFPYLLDRLATKMWKWANHIEYVPQIFPKKEWVQYGADIKTRVSFKNNLERILDLGRQKGDKVLLVTFAYYVPKDYSYEKFKNYQLDYTFLDWSAPIEEWGSPANVVKGIDVHNEVIRELAGEHPEVLLIDQAKLMPKSGVYFRDICHLSPAGFEKFAGNIAPMIIKNVSGATDKGRGLD